MLNEERDDAGEHCGVSSKFTGGASSCVAAATLVLFSFVFFFFVTIVSLLFFCFELTGFPRTLAPEERFTPPLPELVVIDDDDDGLFLFFPFAKSDVAEPPKSIFSEMFRTSRSKSSGIIVALVMFFF